MPLSSIKLFLPCFPDLKMMNQSILNRFQTASTLIIIPLFLRLYNLIEDFEKLAWHQEEPFPSSSIYAQYKVFELAKKHNVKVLLDGQGADEILAGYHKYVHWYLQEMVSRYKFSGIKRKNCYCRKTV